MFQPLSSEPWTARWIGYGYDPREELGVFAFRNVVSLTELPGELSIRISADQRYKLLVNDDVVAFGPQRGDARHWFYDTIDLAPHLKIGDNSIVALVWNFGWMAPMAQHSVRTAFVCDAPSCEGLSTPGDWAVARLEGWDFRMMVTGAIDFYIDVGPGEAIDARALPEGWDTGLSWNKPHDIVHAEYRGLPGGGTQWMLVPRSIPAMRYERSRITPTVRRGFVGDSPGGIDGVPLGRDVTIGAGTKLVLDYGELLCAYPRAHLDGPSGATAVLTFAESLWNVEGAKGNRNDAAGKTIYGYEDRFVLDGTPRTFEPLWWRTYRYLQIEADQDVRLLNLEAIETGYPLKEESSFEADYPWIGSIWDVSVRTAERCAGETYFDCPYYEQLQYAGDTRIQVLIGYYLGRDRALTRNAVETLGWSLMENGLTQSRYPSRQTQVIPPFSLWWLMMLRDQQLYDDPMARPGCATDDAVRGVLEAYRQLSELDELDQFWQFGDWVPGWRWGVPPGSAKSPMHQLTYALARKAVGELLGDPSKFLMPAMRRNAEGLIVSVGGAPDQAPTEHAEALGRLLDPNLGPWPEAALAAAKAARCTYYPGYYKHLAMSPNDYVSELADWHEMIENGLTTFAENPEPTRSDCHAWSAHPILGFFQIVAGVTSIAPGWAKARIEPNPGSLRRFNARIAHPRGDLTVVFDDGRLAIDTPVDVEFVWLGKTARLAAGSHQI